MPIENSNGEDKMNMDPKSTWPVVKFIVAATGFRRREARAVLDEIPKDRYSRLFMEAATWERETEGHASKVLRELLDGAEVRALAEASERARFPSTADMEEAEELVAPSKKRARQKKG